MKLSLTIILMLSLLAFYLVLQMEMEDANDHHPEMVRPKAVSSALPRAPERTIGNSLSGHAATLEKPEEDESVDQHVVLKIEEIEQNTLEEFRAADLEALIIDYESDHRVQFRINEYKDRSDQILQNFRQEIMGINELSPLQRESIMADYFKRFARISGDFGARSREFVVKKVSGEDQKAYFQFNERQFVGSSLVQLAVDMPSGSLVSEETIGLESLPEYYDHLFEQEEN